MKLFRSNTLKLAVTGCVVTWTLLDHHCAAAGTSSDTNSPLFIECRGSVKPRQELTLRLRPAERVMSARLAVGDEAKTGDPLAEIFDGEAWTRLLDLKRMRLESLLSRNELKLKADRLARVEDELKAQLGLWQAVEPSSAERRVAALREKRDELSEQVELLRLRISDPANIISATGPMPAALETQIKNLEAQLASALVVAPFSGRVAYVTSHPTRLAAGETVLEFWDTNVVVRAEVLQHQLAHVTRGCQAEVSLDFSDEKPARATVDAVEMRAEIQAGEAHPTFGVRLVLDGTTDRLKPGMRVSVRIRTEGRKANQVAP